VYVGFLAQAVEAAAWAVSFNFDSMPAPASTRDHYGLSYAQLVVPLVRTVQEMSTKNAALQARLRRLEAATGG